MVIVDRELAILPAPVDGPGTQSASVLVRPGPLLERCIRPPSARARALSNRRAPGRDHRAAGAVSPARSTRKPPSTLMVTISTADGVTAFPPYAGP